MSQKAQVIQRFHIFTETGKKELQSGMFHLHKIGDAERRVGADTDADIKGT